MAVISKLPISSPFPFLSNVSIVPKPVVRDAGIRYSNLNLGLQRVGKTSVEKHVVNMINRAFKK